MLIMPPPQEMSHVQNISSITIIANDILYNKLVQHINAGLKPKVTKKTKTLANVLLVSADKSTKKDKHLSHVNKSNVSENML